jgi:hypothetical protein
MFNNITFNLTLYPSTSHLYHVRWLESSKSAQAGNLLAPEEMPASPMRRACFFMEADGASSWSSYTMDFDFNRNGADDVSNHYRSIGFHIATDDDIEALVDQHILQGAGREVKTPDSHYVEYLLPGGEQLTLPFDEQGRIIDLHPHYRGQGRMTARLEKVLTRDQLPLELSYFAWANPKAGLVGEEARGDYPFLFEVPEYGPMRRLQSLPQTVSVQIAAFAYELSCYADVAEYQAANDPDMPMAVESFIPTGLFADPDGGGEPRAEAMLSGRVLACERKTNAYSGQDYWALLVKTLGGTIDVVSTPQTVEGHPQVGGICKGVFWLSGQLVSD